MSGIEQGSDPLEVFLQPMFDRKADEEKERLQELRACLEDVIDENGELRPGVRPPLRPEYPKDDPYPDVRGSLEAIVRDICDREAEVQSERGKIVCLLQRKIEVEIAGFKGAKSEQGKLLHPYFDEVWPAMIALRQTYLASDQAAPSLFFLYEAAVLVSPLAQAMVWQTVSTAKPPRPREKDDEIAAVLKKHGYHDDKSGKPVAFIARLIEPDLNMSNLDNPLDAIRQRIKRYYERRNQS